MGNNLLICDNKQDATVDEGANAPDGTQTEYTRKPTKVKTI